MMQPQTRIAPTPNTIFISETFTPSPPTTLERASESPEGSLRRRIGLVSPPCNSEFLCLKRFLGVFISDKFSGSDAAAAAVAGVTLWDPPPDWNSFLSMGSAAVAVIFNQSDSPSPRPQETKPREIFGCHN